MEMCRFLKNVLDIYEILPYLCAVDSATQREFGRL